MSQTLTKTQLARQLMVAEGISFEAARKRLQRSLMFNDLPTVKYGDQPVSQSVPDLSQVKEEIKSCQRQLQSVQTELASLRTWTQTQVTNLNKRLEDLE